MPSACAPDCNTPHMKQELAVGAAHQRSAFGPGTPGAQCRSSVPQCHFATATPCNSPTICRPKAARPRWAYSRRILVREGRADPATSVSSATHIQVVSRATRDQADPLAPAGWRFGNFVFGANDGARAFATNAEDECGRRPRRALQLRGHQKQAALKDQRY